ncbi:MAG: PsbP-related protein [Bacillota bacterium]
MKKLFVLGLVLVMSMSLAACLPGDGNGGDVWEDYSGEHFGFKYPEEWSVIDKEEEEYIYRAVVGDTETEDDMEEGFTVSYDSKQENVDEEEWENQLKEVEDEDDKTLEFGEFEGEIIDFEEYNIDGYSAVDIKVEGEEGGDSYYLNFIFLYKEDDEQVYQIAYIGIEDKYNEEMKEDIIDSFEVN